MACSGNGSVYYRAKMSDIQASLDMARTKIESLNKTPTSEFELFVLDGPAKFLWGAETGDGEALFYTHTGPEEICVEISRSILKNGHDHFKLDITSTVGGAVTLQKSAEFEMYYDDNRSKFAAALQTDVLSNCMVNCLNEKCPNPFHPNWHSSACIAWCGLKCAF